ncbi:MAG: TetR family transcriptional regulator [Beijerinckiaceae bacterium]|nr:TetR family transcriptional regulator [Beijerinckiaceae bacterium]MCZ8301806.1 TetR family transcriptional regulator [Beijerinckiaceae bacterium]
MPGSLLPSPLQPRERILRTAASAFSQRGFHGVTIRDLAQQANVNLAAINYHFRTKEELYTAVIDAALAQWLAETVVLDDAPENAPLELVIRLLVSALVAPVIEREDSPILPRLIAWDLLQGNAAGQVGSSPGVTRAIRNQIRPYLSSQLGPETIDLVASWLVSQCLLLAPALRTGRAPDFEESRVLATRIADLALGGIRALMPTR